jgi:hypothetical protein
VSLLFVHVGNGFVLFLGCLVLCQMIALLCLWFVLCYFLFLISLSLLMHAIASCSFRVHQDLFSFCIITCEVIDLCLLCAPLHLRFINFCSLCVPLPVRSMPTICCVWCCFCQSHPLCFVCHHFSFVLCPITCDFILQCYFGKLLRWLCFFTMLYLLCTITLGNVAMFFLVMNCDFASS